MNTKVHQVLGKDRINSICDSFLLTEEDKKMVDVILENWENLIGNPIKKMAIAMEITKDVGVSTTKKIIFAITEISFQFLEMQIKNK